MVLFLCVVRVCGEALVLGVSRVCVEVFCAWCVCEFVTWRSTVRDNCNFLTLVALRIKGSPPTFYFLWPVVRRLCCGSVLCVE